MNLITVMRKAKGMTRTALAKLVGVSEATVSRWESGKIHSIKHDKVLLLARTLGIVAEEILSTDLKEDYDDSGRIKKTIGTPARHSRRNHKRHGW